MVRASSTLLLFAVLLGLTLGGAIIFDMGSSMNPHRVDDCISTPCEPMTHTNSLDTDCLTHCIAATFTTTTAAIPTIEIMSLVLTVFALVLLTSVTHAPALKQFDRRLRFAIGKFLLRQKLMNVMLRE